MKESIKHIFSDKIIAYGSFLWLIFLIFGLLIILFSYSHLPPFLPLFNQMPWGVSRLASKEQIFIPSFVTTIIFFGNFFFAVYLYGKVPLTARILSLTSVLVGFLILLLIIKIMLLIL